MKTPVVVTLMLATAILLAASLLYATGTRGDDARWLQNTVPAIAARGDAAVQPIRSHRLAPVRGDVSPR